MKKQTIEAVIIKPRIIYAWDRIILIIIFAMLINLICGMSLFRYILLDIWAWILITTSVIASLLTILVIIYTLLNPKIKEEKEVIPIKLK